MKSFLSVAIIVTSLLSFSSCSENSVVSSVEEQPTEQLLSVTTNIEVASRSVLGKPINNFVSGDEIGLYVSNGSGVMVLPATKM